MARRRDQASSISLEALVDVPRLTVTQTPALGLYGPIYTDSVTFASLAMVSRAAGRRYDDLPGAWRLAAEPVKTDGRPSEPAWPWRTGLADPVAAAPWNGANLLLPAMVGRRWFRMVIRLETPTTALRVSLLREGIANRPIEIELPTMNSREP